LVDVQRLFAPWPLRDADHGAALIHRFDDPVAIECLVCQQRAELNPVDQRCHADGVVAIARQQVEAHEIAEGIRQRQDLGRPATLRLAYGLALRPPFAPWPWR